MRLTNIRKLGRYENKETGQQVNIHKGQRPHSVGDVIFFIRSGERVQIPEADFYRGWKRLPEGVAPAKRVTNKQRVDAINALPQMHAHQLEIRKLVDKFGVFWLGGEKVLCIHVIAADAIKMAKPEEVVRVCVSILGDIRVGTKIIKAREMVVTYSDGSSGPFGSLENKVVELDDGAYTVYDTRGGRPAFQFKIGTNNVTAINFA